MSNIVKIVVCFVFLLPVLIKSKSPVYKYKEFLSSNLPIIVIDTQGKRIPDEPRITAQMGIIYNGSQARNSVENPLNHYDGQISIEIRGNSSQDFPKKAYALETQNADGSNFNVSLLGMPEENDWILYAPYSDKSLMRNVLTFKLARDMGRYAPRTRFCELVVNDDYKGVYVLMEKIKRDKNRIDIAELTTEDIEGDALTGGYILKLDWDDEKSAGWESPIDGTLFHYHHPQKDNLKSVQKQYIQNFIIEFEEILSGSNYLNSEKGYADYLDMGSFVDYFISAELAHNADSYRISIFMFKERDSRGGKLSMGPQWDYNLAYGNQDEGSFGGWKKWSWEVGLDPINFWWERFLSDTEFTGQIEERWLELRENILHENRILGYIDSLVEYLDEAQIRNFERWPVLGEWIWPNAYVGETYQDEIGYLKNFIRNRLNWVDDHIGDLDIDDSPGPESGYQPPVLAQVYPNPFGSTITFEYELQSPRFVAVNIYNILGQKIESLGNSHQDPGLHRITWSGRDVKGMPVAAGIYFCVLKVHWEVHTVFKVFKH